MNVLIIVVTAQPSSANVTVLHDVTLTCKPKRSMPTGYSWHRVNGNIPLHSSGQNSSRLTIHRIVLADEGNYYCMATGYGHCANSNIVEVIVTSKKYYVAIQVFNQITLSYYQCMYSYNH